mgnify:CR=1 FL=1
MEQTEPIENEKKKRGLTSELWKSASWTFVCEIHGSLKEKFR